MSAQTFLELLGLAALLGCVVIVLIIVVEFIQKLRQK